MSWLDKLKDQFVEDCKKWWKLWSSWLAIIWGAIVTALWNEPTVLQEITNAMPEQYRALLSPFVFLVVSGLPIVVRLLKQSKLDQQNRGQQ